MSEVRTIVRLSNEDAAEAILAAADAVSGNRPWNLYRLNVVAGAVAFGRKLGAQVSLEPMDDALRSAVDDELIGLVRKHEPGRHGWIDTLFRLKGFLERYPVRGRGDDGVGPTIAKGPEEAPPIPEIDLGASGEDIGQRVALARLVLLRHEKGGGGFEPADAKRLGELIDEWWKISPRLWPKED